MSTLSSTGSNNISNDIAASNNTTASTIVKPTHGSTFNSKAVAKSKAAANSEAIAPSEPRPHVTSDPFVPRQPLEKGVTHFILNEWGATEEEKLELCSLQDPSWDNEEEDM